MVGSGPISRWHKLRAILNIRHGPGAAVLPSSVTRIHLEFAKSNSQGHMGPRKFWRDILPRLKFYNPSIPMIVNRKENNEGTAIMTIYYLNQANAAAAETQASSPSPVTRVQPPSSALDGSKAAPPATDERVVKIDMKNKHSDDILDLFMSETRAEQQEPSPEEEAELRDAADLKRKGDYSRKLKRAYNEEKKKEENMLKAAREASDE